ncbi:hypothetical protein ACVWWK_005978 [Bradyrhizobium sp. LB9.1b]
MDRFLMDSAQAVEVKEKAPEAEGHPAIASSPERFINRELSLAALQPPRPGGIGQCQPPHAGAGAIPVDFSE